MAEDTPETTEPTEPVIKAQTTNETEAPAKEPERIMCTLENIEGGHVRAKCPKPKLEAVATTVQEAQDDLRAQAAEKGVEAELAWKWA